MFLRSSRSASTQRPSAVLNAARLEVGFQLKTAIIASFALLALCLFAQPARAQQARLAEDASLSSSSPIAVNGSNSGLTVSTIGGVVQNAYLKFELTESLPPGTKAEDVEKAVLKLYVASVGSAGSISVQRALSSWDERLVTYLTRPSLGEVVGSAYVRNRSQSYVEIDVTGLVKEWIKGPSAGGVANYGVALVGDSARINVTFDSKENTATGHQPTLEIIRVDSALRAKVDAESASRQAADADLLAQLNNEATARQNADSLLQTALDSARLALQANIESEAAARAAADALEAQTRQSALNSEISARQTADDNLQTAITNEANARENAVNTLQNALNNANAALAAETQAREAALAAEATARAAGDTNLQNALSAEAQARQTDTAQLQNLISALQSALAAETISREAGDAQTLATAKNYSDAKFMEEAAARAAAVSNLNARIESLQTSLTIETAARRAADELLQSAISREIADRAAADARIKFDIENESSARQAGDASTLNAAKSHTDSSVAAEKAERQAADSQEASARQTGDAQEAAARQAGDAQEASARQAAISQEATSRQAGDAATLAAAQQYASQQVSDEAATRQQQDANLQTQINNEVTLRQSGDTGLQTQLNTSNMTTDQAIQALTARLNELTGQTAPVGTIMAFAGPATKIANGQTVSNIPAGWELCDGRLLTRDANTQPLFDAIGATWGSNDGGVSTFRLPDLRGQFLRGLDNSPALGPNGTDYYRNNRYNRYTGGNTGNAVGSYQEYVTGIPRYSYFWTNVTGHHNHNNGPYDRLLIFDGHGTIAQGTDSAHDGRQPNIEWQAPMVATGNHQHYVSYGGDGETAPRNAAVLYIIRVK